MIQHEPICPMCEKPNGIIQVVSIRFKEDLSKFGQPCRACSPNYSNKPSKNKPLLEMPDEGESKDASEDVE